VADKAIFNQQKNQSTVIMINQNNK